MKIEKNKVVKSAENIDELDPVLAPEEALLDEADIVEETCAYDQCIDYIHQAIDCLVPCANEDPVAKESIANLSVVLLDLQK